MGKYAHSVTYKSLHSKSLIQFLFPTLSAIYWIHIPSQWSRAQIVVKGIKISQDRMNVNFTDQLLLCMCVQLDHLAHRFHLDHMDQHHKLQYMYCDKSVITLVNLTFQGLIVSHIGNLGKIGLMIINIKLT